MERAKDKDEKSKMTMSELSFDEFQKCVNQMKELIGFMDENGGVAKFFEMFEDMKNKAYLAKEILTMDESADYLGVTKAYLYRLTARKDFPVFKPNGKLIFICKSDLVEWVMHNRLMSKTEIDKEAERRLDVLKSERRQNTIHRLSKGKKSK